MGGRCISEQYTLASWLPLLPLPPPPTPSEGTVNGGLTANGGASEYCTYLQISTTIHYNPIQYQHTKLLLALPALPEL